MNPLRPFISTFTFTCVLVAPLAAAEVRIVLQPEDIARLGIAFAPVASSAAGVGARLPATVISSPEGVSTLNLPFGGAIEVWHVTPGTEVKPGQPLVQIRSQEVLQAQQDWMAAVTAEETARFEREKSERLLAEGVVSAQRVQQARRAHEQTAFAVRAAADNLRRAGFDARGLAALRSKGEGLGRYTLGAPGAGVVTRRSGAAGDFVAANSAIVRLRPGGTDWVRLHAPARAVAGLAPGQTLKVSGSGETLVVRQRDRSVEDGSQTLEVLAEFARESALLPGQVITVELPAPAGGVLVPAAAVVHSGEEASVFVRTAAGIEARRIDLLPLGADYLASAGVQVGEEVVVRGAAVLKGIKAGLGRNE